MLPMSSNEKDLLQGMFEYANLVVLILSSDFSVLEVNKKAEEVFNWQPGEALNKNFLALGQKLEINISSENLKAVLKNKKTIKNLFTKIAANKKIFFISWSIFSLGSAKDELRLVMIGQDITAYLNTTIYLENIVNNVPGMIFWKDLNSIFLGCNKPVSDLAGLSSPQEIVGKSDYDLPWTKAESDHYRKDDLEVINSGKPKLNIEETQTLADGRVITLLTNKVPLLDERGKIIGVLGIYSDITDLKRKEVQLKKTNDQLNDTFDLVARSIEEQKSLQRQLREKNKALLLQNRRAREATRLKSLFLANMSHELRTPLNGIIGFTDLLRSEIAGPVSSEQKEYLHDILTSSRHLLLLINDILDLSKIESGKMKFNPELIKLEVMIKEVCESLKAINATKKITLTTKLDPDLSPIFLDAARLKQVLYNYLSNAYKFSPEAGKIWLNILPENEDYFRLEVIDTGIGIRKKDMDKLFIHFQQLDSSMTKKYQGTGLGLALTRRIVEAQGGRVGASSVFRKGSTFYAVLPFSRKLKKMSKK